MTTTTEPERAQLQSMPLAKLVPAADNPRHDLGDLSELVQSIKTGGLHQPLVAVAENGHYKIVVGHRRFAAAKLAGLDTVDVIVRELDEPARISAMLVENLQREDLTALEEAHAYRRLLDDCGLTQRQLAERIGRSQAHISKRVQLLELPEKVQAKLDSGGITLEDAVELAKLKDDPKAIAAIARDSYNIPHAVKEHIRRAKLEAAHRELIAEAKKAGVKILSPVKDRYRQYQLPKGTVEIAKGGGWDALSIDPAKHAGEPCHAIVDIPAAGFSKPRAVIVCTDRRRHPNAKTEAERMRRTSSSGAPNAAEKRARELRKAAAPRRAFAGVVAKGGLPAADHNALVLDTLITSAHSEVLKVACQMLLPDRPAGNGFRDFGDALREYAAKRASAARQVELAIAFATHEEFLTGPWNGWAGHAGYLNLLQEKGYDFGPAERQKAGKELKPAKKARSKAAA